jgi:DNA-directed RNA polymerase subunit M/transcription elongation factor TFIIS
MTRRIFDDDGFVVYGRNHKEFKKGDYKFCKDCGVKLHISNSSSNQGSHKSCDKCYNKQRYAKIKLDKQKYAKRLQQNSDYIKKRYAEDEVFRENLKESMRTHYHEDHEYRQKTIDRAIEVWVGERQSRQYFQTLAMVDAITK